MIGAFSNPDKRVEVPKSRMVKAINPKTGFHFKVGQEVTIRRIRCLLGRCFDDDFKFDPLDERDHGPLMVHQLEELNGTVQDISAEGIVWLAPPVGALGFYDEIYPS